MFKAIYILMQYAALTIFLTIVAAAQSPTQLEINVLNTYRKLLWANRLSALQDPGRIATLDENNLMSIEVLSIQSGPIREIRSMKVDELISKPEGRLLMAIPGIWTDRTDSNAYQGSTLDVVWVDGMHLTENWKVPLNELLLSDQQEYSDFVHLKLKIKYQTETRVYTALVLLTIPDPVTSNRKANFLDHIVGGSALNLFWKEDLKTSILSSKRFRGTKAVEAFINRHLVNIHESKSRAEFSCKSALDLLCRTYRTYEDEKMINPGPGVLRNGISKPITTAECQGYDYDGNYGSYGETNYNGHYTGYHSANSLMRGHCTYSGTSSCHCEGSCSISLEGNSIYESGGLTTSSCHKTGANSSSAGTSSGPSPSCARTWGAAVRACLFCNCDVTIGFSPGVTFPGDAVWTVQHTQTQSCVQKP